MRPVSALVAFYVLFNCAGIFTRDIGAQAVMAASKEPTTGGEKTAPTASDQPENEADRKITQQIRQSVTKDDSLSTSAQNVTIVTRDGKVTLRGTVKNDSEKQKIAEAAKKASGVKSVENLITVKQ
jgi:osmotically-inducible protein OsmY